MGAALKLQHPPLRTPRGTEPSAEPMVSLSQVLSALSHALDLTEGQPLGHTIRACVIGMRIAESLKLSADERSALYYALLLKDTGCSSNATRMAAIFGSDDRCVKQRMRVADWHAKMKLALTTAAAVGHGKSVIARVRHFFAVARSEKLTTELIGLRCERGATIAERLGFPQASADAIRSLDEHWCGLGHAQGLSGESIPLLARICSIAQTVDVFHTTYGLDGALRVIQRRSGTWFDPALVKIVSSWRRDVTWWRGLKTEHVNEVVVSLEPADRVVMADADRLDTVALAFADIIDAKSPYTYNHSMRVAAGARFVAEQLGMDAEAQRRTYRMGLLHDIGKLGVSSQTLNKTGPLTVAERAEIEQHPRYSYSILSRVAAFQSFAWTASLHHERLDGTGYPWRLPAEQLDDAARLLAVADVYDALVSDRPYRAGLPHDTAVDVLWSEAGTRLSREAVQAIAEWPSD
jgi:HD-GYP domain-containing protein (c-di-GMP phosphodiesterase class II)